MSALSSDLILQRFAEQTQGKLYQRLYNAIRSSILDASLRPLSRLPASRDLAKVIGISRNTVLTVFEQLLSEGYILSRSGSGTFVAQTVPDSYLSAAIAQESQSNNYAQIELSTLGTILLENASASPQQWEHLFRGYLM